MGTLSDYVFGLLWDNKQLIALAVVAVAVLGTLLGSLKKLAVALFAASLKAGEKGTAAITSKKGLRVAVPLALASTLFGGGFLLGASKAKVEYIASPPEIVTRDVVKEVVREVKVPTFIEKMIEVPMKIVTPPANAKCYFCAALLNVDGVPEPQSNGFGNLMSGFDPLCRCGGCDGTLNVKLAKVQFRFKRKEKLWLAEPGISHDVDFFTAPLVGRDPIPKPDPPPADAPESSKRKYKDDLEFWRRQCSRFIER